MFRPFKSEAGSVILLWYEARNGTDDWINGTASFALQGTFGDRTLGIAVDDSEPGPTRRTAEVYNVLLAHQGLTLMLNTSPAILGQSTISRSMRERKSSQMCMRGKPKEKHLPHAPIERRG